MKFGAFFLKKKLCKSTGFFGGGYECFFPIEILPNFAHQLAAKMNKNHS